MYSLVSSLQVYRLYADSRHSFYCFIVISDRSYLAFSSKDASVVTGIMVTMEGKMDNMHVLIGKMIHPEVFAI